LSEEKKVVDPALAGFYEATDYLKIPVIAKVLIWKVETKMPKIGPGG
jgi:hypothetical protein